MQKVSLTSFQFEIELFAVIIKYLSLKEIFQKIMSLNSRVRHLVVSENYTLMKKLF